MHSIVASLCVAASAGRGQSAGSRLSLTEVLIVGRVVVVGLERGVEVNALDCGKLTRVTSSKEEGAVK